MGNRFCQIMAQSAVLSCGQGLARHEAPVAPSTRCMPAFNAHQDRGVQVTQQAR